ncbi:methylated-DNA--[protein]-cysteine S-methyltransferase [Paramicrobacterium agarici]|uniref:methylated-DNA--[protein]-cysteine S-methyltransferase n=1 Tax=Paramicrobacterium agarici TaxID=630514 RepID=A0A2A9DX70_9MICO|nr:methylated-DNA--[protein]-cysteine S-methyltransferase [Microbacterium agarici]PFG30941.1 methylated-DNA-[protein]-cysteine S-methyltransferase [Microbacterium agarici]
MTTPPFDIPEYLAVVSSPIGRLELTSEGHTVTSVTVEDDGALPHDDLPRRSNDVLDEAAAQLCEYFDGARRDFSVPVSANGTAFQRAVWDGLSLVPYGSVISYAELGSNAVGTRSGRAVGRAVAANPLLLLIPSHRVVSASGKVTGFAGSQGVKIKRWLLEHELVAA